MFFIRISVTLYKPSKPFAQLVRHGLQTKRGLRDDQHLPIVHPHQNALSAVADRHAVRLPVALVAEVEGADSREVVDAPHGHETGEADR